MIDLKQFFKNIAIKLSGGSHPSPESGLCIMECVAYVEGEAHSDHPKCACPVVTAFAMRTNDSATDEQRQRLLPFVLRIAGSKSSKEIERQRAFMCADYAVRVFSPMRLRLRKLEDAAKRLESCAPIIDEKTALAANKVANEVKKSAYAAAAAAAYADAAADAHAAAAAAADADADADADAHADADADADAHAAAAAAADADADAHAAAAAAADADAYKKIKDDIFDARLRLLDDMLKLTDAVDITPEREAKLMEAQKLQPVTV